MKKTLISKFFILPIFSLLITAVGLGLFSKFNTARRPKYIFINETSNHRHDLALKMSLKLAEKRAGVENALILLKELPPDKSIEETALQLFKKWDIGRDRGGRGILYLYSEKQNLLKIEISYALEGQIPDAFCRRLEAGAKTYMLSEIPQDFLSELIITMNIQAQEHKSETAQPDLNTPTWMTSEFLSGGAGVQARGLERSVEEYQRVIKRLNAEEFKEFLPSATARETLEKYLQTLQRGLGEPQLPLLTEGSQIFRVVVPRSPAQQRRVLDYYQKALPYQLREQGNLALAVFKPGVANLPIVLRKSQNSLWYIDEPKAWTYFHRYESENDFFPKYSDLTLNEILVDLNQPHSRRPIYRDRVKTPAPPAYPFSLTLALKQAESSFQRLGELYLFEMNWVSKAIWAFEAAKKKDRRALTIRWRLLDLYMNNSEMEKALAELEFLHEQLPNDKQVQEWYQFYKKEYDFKPGEFF